MRRALIIAACLWPACAYRLGPPRVHYADDVATLPLVQPTTDPRRWYVPVSSEVAGDHLLFVDTGYTFTTCDDDFVAALGLATRGSVPVRGELGKLPTTKANLPPLLIGGHRSEGVTCQVRDLGSTSSLDDPDEVPIAGVLGMDVLRRFRVAFDPAEGTVELAPPDHAPLPKEGEGIVKLKRELRVGIRVVLPVGFDDLEQWPILDTGATDTYIDGQRLGLEPSEIVSGATLRGTGGSGTERRDLIHYDIGRVQLGSLHLGPVELTDRPRRGGTDGLLGLDVLGQLRAEYDWSGRRARFVVVEPVELPLWLSWRDEPTTSVVVLP